jgi:hypothetical protein
MALVLDGNGTMTVGNGDITGITRGAIESTAIGAGAVLQVVNTYYTTATSQSITSGTVNNITGLEAIITPASTSSRILIFIRWFGEHGTDNQNWETMFGITRDGTAIGLPAQPGSVGLGMAMASLSYYAANADSTPENVFYSFLDSPSTTSAVTYRAYATPQVTEVLYTNRVAGATTSGGFERGTSSIMLMEIAG